MGVCVGGRKALEEEDDGKRTTSIGCLFLLFDRISIRLSIHAKKYGILVNTLFFSEDVVFL